LAFENKASETHLTQAWKHPICTPAPDSAHETHHGKVWHLIAVPSNLGKKHERNYCA